MSICWTEQVLYSAMLSSCHSASFYTPAELLCDIGVECSSKRTGSGRNAYYSLERCYIDVAGTVVNVTQTRSKSPRACNRQENLCAAFISGEIEVFDFSDNAVCVGGGCQASFNVCAVFPTSTVTSRQSVLETITPLSVQQTPVPLKTTTDGANVSTTHVSILNTMTNTTVLMPQRPSTARVSTCFTSATPSTDGTTSGKVAALTKHLTSNRPPRTTNTLSFKSSNFYSIRKIFALQKLTSRNAVTGPFRTTTMMSVSTTVAQTITATNVFRKSTATPVWQDSSHAITISQNATIRNIANEKKFSTISEPTYTYLLTQNRGLTVNATHLTKSTLAINTETKSNQSQSLTKLTATANSIVYSANTTRTEYTDSFTIGPNDYTITNALDISSIAGIVSGGAICLVIIGLVAAYAILNQDKCRKVSTSPSSR